MRNITYLYQNSSKSSQFSLKKHLIKSEKNDNKSHFIAYVSIIQCYIRSLAYTIWILKKIIIFNQELGPT